VRNAVEHFDENLLGKQKYKASPPFDKAEPYHSGSRTLRWSLARRADVQRPLAALPSWLRPARRGWRKSKLAILSVTLHHHPQGQKVHLHRAGY
jgi:hypothetical protein